MALLEYLFGFFVGIIAGFEIQIIWFQNVHRLYSPIETFRKIATWLTKKGDDKK